MFDLSVVICAHNPRADHLRRALNSLQQQILPFEKWEFLLIDNASTDPLVSSWDLSWHPHARHISESKLGLSAARQRAIREATSDLLVFVDDDNVLDRTYLTEALSIKEKWPQLGTWGSGSIIPEYEAEPQPEVQELIPYLAVRKIEKGAWSNVRSCREATPWGAGMCVRAAVAEAYCRINDESKIHISGRRGGGLASDEDVEMSYVACHLGLGMGVFPELKLTHLIRRERVSRQHLLKLLEASVISGTILEYKWTAGVPASPFRLRNLPAILKNLVARRGFDRQVYFTRVRASVKAGRIIAAREFGSAGK